MSTIKYTITILCTRMESEKVERYLKRKYLESPTAEKRVKFSGCTIPVNVMEFSTGFRICSESVRKVFPLSTSKQSGSTYVYGIETTDDSHSDPAFPMEEL